MAKLSDNLLNPAFFDDFPRGTFPMTEKVTQVRVQVAFGLPPQDVRDSRFASLESAVDYILHLIKKMQHPCLRARIDWVDTVRVDAYVATLPVADAMLVAEALAAEREKG